MINLIKRHRLPFIIAIAVLAVSAAAAAALIIKSSLSPGEMSVDLYFMDEKETGIVAEHRDIKYRDSVDLIETALEKLKKGPSSSRNKRIMPKDTRLLRIEFSDNARITVDFSDEFLSSDASKNVLSIYAVVKTLCSTGRISEVKVTVEGENVNDNEGEPLGFIAASDINLETEEYSSEMRSVVLYFVDEKSGKLAKEERAIKIIDQQAIEKYIIDELIKGPSTDKLKRTLSDKTVLISAEVEDNICYLNFRSNFLSVNPFKGVDEQQAVYSIVNSLTELQTISRVQFYIDGKRVDKFGQFDIKGYISRNPDMIEE